MIFPVVVGGMLACGVDLGLSSVVLLLLGTQWFILFNVIVQALKESPSHELDEAVVLSQLALTFPPERPQRILRTVVAWARYAALFKCSSTRKVFHGLEQPAGTP
jgi:hypothetical protein